MHRSDHTENIQKLYDRVRLANEMIDESLRSGRDFLECIDKAKEVLAIKAEIETLKPKAKGNVPVQNQITRLKKQLKKLKLASTVTTH